MDVRAMKLQWNAETAPNNTSMSSNKGKDGLIEI